MTSDDTTPAATTTGSTTARGGAASRTRRVLLVAASLAALGAAVLLAGPPRSELPLDPDGVGAQGLGAMVAMLEDLNVEVTVRVQPPEDTTPRALVAVDRLDAATRTAWQEWVAAGGTLVLADPTSPLSELSQLGSDRFLGREQRVSRCRLLPEGTTVRQGAWDGLEVPDDAQGCFPVGDDGAAWMVVAPQGDGLLVALGSAEPLTNGLIDQADNAVVAAVLLGPAPGDRLVIVPRDPTAGAGQGGLLALIPDRVWGAVALVVLALGLAVLWQGRRDGAVVTERLPPVLPSAELTRSIAGLLQRAGDPHDGAERLRRAARRSAARALGLHPHTPEDVLIRAVTTRTAVADGDAEVALGTGRVADDAALVEVAEACTRLRAGLRRPPGTSSDPAASAPPPTSPDPTRS